MKKYTWVLAFIVVLQSIAIGETNMWPLFHKQDADASGRLEKWSFLGPVVGRTNGNEFSISSFRPLYTEFDFDRDTNDHWHVFYPLLNYYRRNGGYHWNILNLVSRQRHEPTDLRTFDVFPFFFSRSSAIEESNYLALWPVAGQLKDRFWRDEIDFILWPLWVKTVNEEEIYHHFPYPFLRKLSGPESSGFGVWPLYGRFTKENDYRKTWALWPLIYSYKDQLDQPVPYERFGVWPFYHHEKADGLRSFSFIWPFFGYTDESAPRPIYREYRYFWPFIVQGTGEEKSIHRWLPLYAHESHENYNKWWYLWPLWKRELSEDSGMTQRRNSLLFFIFQDEVQCFANTSARKTTLWPLASYWNNGDERKQFQMLDPFTVFFPRNEKIRENWSPLFSIYRYDQRIESTRHSLLWNLVVIEHGDRDRFSLGPILEWEHTAEQTQWQLLKGLIGYENSDAGRKLKLIWHSF